MAHTTSSICRNCLAYCPIEVSIEDGRAVKVTGDHSGTIYEGYTCPKGRALPAQHNDPARLLQVLQRDASGAFVPIEHTALIEAIAGKVQRLLTDHGPRSIALYTGTGVVSHPPGPAMAKSWFRAIGSPMVFSAATIDKPAANTSSALHGNWVAGPHTFESSDVWMIIGANPVISKSNGAPPNNPAWRIKEAVRRGMKLIVIDPRRTETARSAHVHLQARPGEDAAILACLIRTILEEGLHDRAFVAEHTRGIEALRSAVAAFDPLTVGARAGVAPDLLIEAARTFARGSRGCAVCSTGPSFAPHSNLAYYLALCLNTLCGRWARQGEQAPYPNVLLAGYVPKAQPYEPYPVFGKHAMRVKGLRENASGMPTAALADEILLEGEGQIKALFCVGGNPVSSWPDRARTERALQALELLVVFDYRMTASAQFAHYVVPPPLSLELPGSTQFVEALKYNGVTRGFDRPWGQYTPPVVQPPAGAKLLDESEFFFRLGQRMGLQLDWVNQRGYGPHVESPKSTVQLDMARVPSIDELIELSCAGSRVPLADVKQHAHGDVFDDRSIIVQPRDAHCTTRLELADPLMMADLASVQGSDAQPAGYLLVCRRANRFMNSVGQELAELAHNEPENAVFACAEDLAQMGVSAGQHVRVDSANGSIVVRAALDAGMRSGVVSVYHGFGGNSGSQERNPAVGSAISRLVGMDEFDPLTGIPRMTGIKVRIQPAG